MLKIKKIIDLSNEIYSNSPHNTFFIPTELKIISTINKDGWYSERINFSPHVGTHVDAPAHRLKNVDTIDKAPLDSFIGLAAIIDLRFKKPEEEIYLKDLEKYDSKISNSSMVLLATGWCKKISQDDLYINRSPYLGAEAAEYLVKKKVKGVGIDHYSIGGSNPDNVAAPHEILMNNNINIFEELNFPDEIFKVDEGYFIGFPLRIRNGSGSPVRAVLVELSE